MSGRIPVTQGRGPDGDGDLVAAARHGDADALDELIRRYQPRVYRFGVTMCGNPDDASDIVQDTLLAMAKSVKDFRGDSSVSSWLYTIARRFCIRKRRRSKYAPVSEQSLDAPGSEQAERLSDPAPGPEQEAAGRELRAALTSAIAALDPPQREVLVLRDIEGLSAPEVAEVLGLGVQAVKSRLHRARLSVRQQVGPMLGSPAPGASPTARCPDIPLMFSRYLEGEIGPDVCAEMEAHLGRCGHCRGTCDSLKRTLAICRTTPVPEVPAEVAASVKRAIRAFLQAGAGGRG